MSVVGRADGVAVILLAAGRSLRHPGPSKLYRPLGAKPLGLHAAQTIATFAPAALIAVCSAATKELMPDYEAMGFELAWNEDPGRGLSSSLAIGIAAARRHRIDAVMLCLADMPFVTLGHLQALVAGLHLSDDTEMVGSRARDTTIVMPPAVFAGAAIGRLQHLAGDVGARALLQGAPSVEVDACELADFDDPAAFAAFETPRST